MFSGSIVALVTPFRNGNVDFDALRRLIDWHVESGTGGLVPVGTTGESPTLNHEEHEEVVAQTVAAAGGRILVIAGTGSNRHSRGSSIHPACSRSRSQCHTRCGAVLQSADPGRTACAFHGIA